MTTMTAAQVRTHTAGMEQAPEVPERPRPPRSYPAAYKLASKISEAHTDNSMLQNDLAWQIATDPKIKDRNLKLAETFANRANEASGGKDAGILDTVARIRFMQGQKDEAIALQEKAVGLADGDRKAQLERTLDSYKRGELTKDN